MYGAPMGPYVRTVPLGYGGGMYGRGGLYGGGMYGRPYYGSGIGMGTRSGMGTGMALGGGMLGGVSGLLPSPPPPGGTPRIRPNLTHSLLIFYRPAYSSCSATCCSRNTYTATEASHELGPASILSFLSDSHKD